MRSLVLAPLLLLVACCCHSNKDPFVEKGREIPWGVYGSDEEFAFTRCKVHEVPLPGTLAGTPHAGRPAAFDREPAAGAVVPPPPLDSSLDDLVRWQAPTTLEHIAALQGWATGKPDGHGAVILALASCVEDGAGAAGGDDPSGRCLRALALLDRNAAATTARAHHGALRDPDTRALAASLDLYPDYTEFLDYMPLRGPLSEEDRQALSDPTLLTLEELLADRDRLVTVDGASTDTAEVRQALLQALAYLVRPELDDALFDHDGDAPRLYLHKSRYTPILAAGEQADAATCVGLINTVLMDQGSLLRVIRVPAMEPALVVIGGRGEGLVRAHDDELIGFEPLSRFPGSVTTE